MVRLNGGEGRGDEADYMKVEESIFTPKRLDAAAMAELVREVEQALAQLPPEECGRLPQHAEHQIAIGQMVVVPVEESARAESSEAGANMRQARVAARMPATKMAASVCPSCLAQHRMEGEGRSWLIRITRVTINWKRLPAAGITDLIRWCITEDAIRTAPAIFEEAPVYAFEVRPGVYGHVAAEADQKPLRALVGYVCDCKATEGEVFGRLNLISGSEWLQEKLLDLARENRIHLIGLSMDARCIGTLTTPPEQGRIFVLTGFKGPASIDLATHPAAGGAFLQPVKSLDTEGALRSRRWLAELRDHRPDMVAKLGNAPTESALLEALMVSQVPRPLRAETEDLAAATARRLGGQLVEAPFRCAL